MPNSQLKCPKCGSSSTYPERKNWNCSECGFECDPTQNFSTEPQSESLDTKVTDAFGNVISTGDSVTRNGCLTTPEKPPKRMSGTMKGGENFSAHAQTQRFRNKLSRMRMGSVFLLRAPWRASIATGPIWYASVTGSSAPSLLIA